MTARLALATVLALLATTLAACGGGDPQDQPDPAVCYVDGKPMPANVCR